VKATAENVFLRGREYPVRFSCYTETKRIAAILLGTPPDERAWLLNVSGEKKRTPFRKNLYGIST